MVFDPFPGISMAENTGQMSQWLAEERTITTHELRSLLLKIDRSCREIESKRAPIPIRLVYARRLVLRALNIRKGMSKEGRP